MATSAFDIGLGGTFTFGGDWGQVTLQVDPETGAVTGQGEAEGQGFEVSSQFGSQSQGPDPKYLFLGLGIVALILIAK